MSNYKFLPNDRTITSDDVQKLNIDNINFILFTEEERHTIKLITYASIIKNLLNLHEKEEKTKLIQKVISDFNKMFKKRLKLEKELCLISIILSEKLWENASNTYQGKEFKIELSNLVFCIWLFDEKKLQKQFLYSRQKIGKIAQTLKSDDAAIIEKNNRDLANYVNQELHKYLEIELPKKKSFLPQLQKST
jgi:hypothetical protein